MARNQNKDLFAPPSQDELLFAPPSADELKSFEALKPSSMKQAVMEGVGQGATMGYLPQLQAMAQPVVERVARHLPEWMVGSEVKNTKLSDTAPLEQVLAEGPGYIESRDKNIQRQQALQAENPIAYGAGNVVGAVGSSMIPGVAAKNLGLLERIKAMGAAKEVALGPLTKGATQAKAVKDFTTPILQNGVTAGTIGLVANPGDTEGQKSGMQIPERIQNAKEMAGLGMLISGGLQTAGAGVGGVSNYFSKKANEKAFKAATGARGKDLQMARQAGDDQELGRVLLDEGAIPILGTTGRIANRVENLKEKAGQEVGRLIKGAGDGKGIDTQKIALQLMDDPSIAMMRKTPGMEGMAEKAIGALETLGKNGDLTMQEALALRQALDKSIKWNRSAPEMRGMQEQLFKQRTAIRDAMNDFINASGNEGKDALLAANRRYGMLEKASGLGEKQLVRDAGNRSVSLTDTIAGAAGMAQGGPTLSLALASLNKMGRAFGNSVQSRGFDATAKALSQIPRVAELAKNNPEAFQVAINRVIQSPQYKKGELKEEDLNQILFGTEKKPDSAQNENAIQRRLKAATK